MKIRFPKNALPICWPVKRLPLGNFLFPLDYIGTFPYLKDLAINQRIIILIFKNNLFPKRSIIVTGLSLEACLTHGFLWKVMISFQQLSQGRSKLMDIALNFPVILKLMQKL